MKLSIPIYLFSFLFSFIFSSLVYSQENNNFVLPDISIFNKPEIVDSVENASKADTIQNIADVQENLSINEDENLNDEIIPQSAEENISSLTTDNNDKVEIARPAPVLGKDSEFDAATQRQAIITIGANFGPHLFYGDLGLEGVFPQDMSNELGFAGSLFAEKQLIPLITLQGQFLYGSLKGIKMKQGDGTNLDLKFHSRLFEYSAHVKINYSTLFLPSDSRVSLYVYTGIGFSHFRAYTEDFYNGIIRSSYGYNSKKDKLKSTVETMVPVGLGATFGLTDNIALHVDAAMRIVNTDKLDAFVSKSSNSIFQDMHFYPSLGVSYTIVSGKNPSKNNEEFASQPDFVTAPIPYSEEDDDEEIIANETQTSDTTINNLKNDKITDLIKTDEKAESFLEVSEEATTKLQAAKPYLDEEDDLEEVKEVMASNKSAEIQTVAEPPVNTNNLIATDQTQVQPVAETSEYTIPESDIELSSAQEKKETEVAKPTQVTHTPSVSITKTVNSSDHDKSSASTVVNSSLKQALPTDESSQKVVYRIQVLAVQTQKDSRLAAFKKQYSITEKLYEEKIDGWYKFTLGNFTTLDEALQYRETLAKKQLQGAFIVPFYNGARITLEQARALQK